MEIDVRPALPTITTPTLILHASRDLNVPIEAARSCRDLIPGAELVELDSDIHLIWLSDVVDEITTQIERFVGRTLPSVAELDRALVTVLAVALGQSGRGPDELFRPIIERWRGRTVRTPDLATFDGPAQALRCAQDVITELQTRGHDVRVGIHIGECAVADGDVRGLAVDIAHQLANDAEPGDVLVSQTVRDLLVGSTIRLQARGRRMFDGVPGEWDVFSVASHRSHRSS